MKVSIALHLKIYSTSNLNRRKSGEILSARFNGKNAHIGRKSALFSGRNAHPGSGGNAHPGKTVP